VPPLLLHLDDHHPAHLVLCGGRQQLRLPHQQPLAVGRHRHALHTGPPLGQPRPLDCAVLKGELHLALLRGLHAVHRLEP